MKSLIILVADKNAQFALKGALGRHKALGISPIEFEIIVHPGRDGGTRKTGAELLALKRRQFEHALMILDHEGCGTELPDASALEAQLDRRLAVVWGDAAKSIVIEPELDVWVWGSDNAVETTIGWPGGQGGVREWLRDRGFTLAENAKPTRPKEALEAALRFLHLPRSSAVYQHFAERISLRHCRDASFVRLRAQLVSWFPV